jgi:DNA-binding GntR family transcriptional regulator
MDLDAHGTTSLPPVRSPARSAHHVTKLGHSLFAGQVAATLRDAIVEGDLPAGWSLVETQLSEQLSVSRGPIRNALQALETEGLVKTHPNGRMVVVGFGPADLSDLLNTRLLLESTGVREGLEADAPLGRVREVFDLIANEPPASERLVELDLLFHRTLVGLGGSRFLVNAWLSLAPVLHSVITVSKRRLLLEDPSDNHRRIVGSHQVIVEAVESRDADGVARMLASQFAITNSMFSDTQRSWREGSGR